MKDTRERVKVKVDQMVLMSLSCEKQQEFNTRPFPLRCNSQQAPASHGNEWWNDESLNFSVQPYITMTCTLRLSFFAFLIFSFLPWQLWGSMQSLWQQWGETLGQAVQLHSLLTRDREERLWWIIYCISSLWYFRCYKLCCKYFN